MKKILIRADDLGYSRSVNFGIFDSVHNGIVNNVGVMVNMPSTRMGLDLLKNEDIDLGMHTNISNGKPVLPAKDIPSLVDKEGNFKRSKVYQHSKKDFVILSEAVAEVDAQYHLFLKLVGRQPDYFEGHAVMSENFRKALQIVAERYHLPFLDFPIGNNIKFKQHTYFSPYLGGYKDGKIDENYDPENALLNLIKYSEDGTTPMYISHAGYLDYYLITHSSLTIPRVKEAQTFTSSRIKEFITDNNIHLVRYSECL